MSRFFKRFYLGIVLVFLYVPILVLIIQSFNGGKSRAKWEGFSLRWYEELLHDQAILGALQVTLSVALIAMVFSTLLGTLAAIVGGAAPHRDGDIPDAPFQGVPDQLAGAIAGGLHGVALFRGHQGQARGLGHLDDGPPAGQQAIGCLHRRSHGAPDFHRPDASLQLGHHGLHGPLSAVGHQHPLGDRLGKHLSHRLFQQLDNAL